MMINNCKSTSQRFILLVYLWFPLDKVEIRFYYDLFIWGRMIEGRNEIALIKEGN